MATICYPARKVGSERKAAGPGFFSDRCKGGRATNSIVLSGFLTLATEMEVVVGNRAEAESLASPLSIQSLHEVKSNGAKTYE